MCTYNNIYMYKICMNPQKPDSAMNITILGEAIHLF